MSPVTPRVMAQSAKTHIVTVAVPACAAGVDITSQPLFVAPADIVIVAATLVGIAAAVGVDAANTSVWELETRLGAVQTSLETETFNNVNTFPAAYTPREVADPGSLGVRVADGALVCLNVTNGATAATPVCLLQIEYWINEDV